MPFFENPAFAPLTIIWTGILGIIFIVMLFKYLGRRSKYRLLERLADKGQTLTPEMLSSISSSHDRNTPANRNPVASGIFLMCIGVALSIFFWATTGFENLLQDGAMPTAIGIFPFMVGLARLLGALANRKNAEPK
jgi:hypothetical protein